MNGDPPVSRTPPPTAPPPAPDLLFDAVITPHRSLGKSGFLVLMLCVALVGFGTGIVFLSLGAWPVFGFLGLDVLLIYLAFRLNYRAARACERISLTAETLIIRRFDSSGQVQETRLPPGWLRIEQPPAGDFRPLRLTTHGQSHPVAAALTDPERRALAESLRAALDSLRQPVFPQDAALRG